MCGGISGNRSGSQRKGLDDAGNVYLYGFIDPEGGAFGLFDWTADSGRWEK